MIIKVLIVIAAASAIAAAAIFAKLKSEEKEKMYRAAERIIQNELLDNSLKNPFLSGAVVDNSADCRLMVNIKVKQERNKQSFVFNPAKTIKIGRERIGNHIIVNEAIVTAYHCMIFMSNDGKPVLQDSSANGTFVKRGMRSYHLTNSQTCVIEDGDCITVGSVRLKVKLFSFDISWI